VRGAKGAAISKRQDPKLHLPMAEGHAGNLHRTLSRGEKSQPRKYSNRLLTRPFFGEADGGTTSSGSPKENYIRKKKKKKRKLGVLKKEIRLNCRVSIEIFEGSFSGLFIDAKGGNFKFSIYVNSAFPRNLTLMEEERMII
jgi:hypothetical protein